MRPACVLTIGGLDPSSGAGITADIKTCEVLDVYGLSVVTAITSQNHQAFRSVQWVALDNILEQLESLIEVYNIKAIKIGLIQNLSTLSELLEYITGHMPDVPIVWDPVLSASAGFNFHSDLDEPSLHRVLKRVTVMTPNKAEALWLFPLLKSTGLENLSVAGCDLFIKSWDKKGGNIIDALLRDSQVTYFSQSLQENHETHGSGCFLATALACEIAKGHELETSLKRAQELTAGYLASSKDKMGFHSSLSLNTMEP